MNMPLKWSTLYKILFYRCPKSLLPLIYVSGTSMFFALFRLSISEARLLSISVALGRSIHFKGTSSTKKKGKNKDKLMID